MTLLNREADRSGPTSSQSLPAHGRRVITLNVLSWCLVGSAWISMGPYFIWTQRETVLLAAALVCAMAGASAFRAQGWQLPERRDLLAGAGLTAFLTYISLQRTVAGDNALWIFVLPTLFALLIVPSTLRATTFRRFELVFLVTLVPGVIYSVLMVVGVPLTFAVRPLPNPLFAAAGLRMLEGFGAVFIESNSQSLPWGGFISRLCGMYDEPGMVGTIAALMLAARGFDMTGWRAIGLWVAGTMSLSLAFVILTVGGLSIRAVVTRRWSPLLWGMPIVIAGLFILGLLRPAAPPPQAAPNVRVEKAPGVVAPAEGSSTVRQTSDINNRSRPEMDALVDRYAAASWRTRFFGIASDASVVYGGASAVWTRVLTNHGILGLTILGLVYVAYTLSSLRRSCPSLPALFFFGAFALSFYQRPVIWLPYALLLFFGAAALFESTRLTPPPLGPRRSPASS